VVDALLHWMEPGGDLAVQCTAAASLRQIVSEEGVVAALTANGGVRANAAVGKLLSLTVTAEGPTRKWQAVSVVMSLVKMGAIAGTVADASIAQIVAALDSSCEAAAAPGGSEQSEMLQAALLDLLTQLAGLSAEVAASVEGAASHMIGHCFAEPDALALSVGEQALELWLALLRQRAPAVTDATAGPGAAAAAAAAAGLPESALLTVYPLLLRLCLATAIGDFLRPAMETLEEYLLSFVRRHLTFCTALPRTTASRCCCYCDSSVQLWPPLRVLVWTRLFSCKTARLTVWFVHCLPAVNLPARLWHATHYRVKRCSRTTRVGQC
jgi:hypothetical protein